MVAGATRRRGGGRGRAPRGMAAITPLTRIEATLARAAADLDALGRRWALVGGFAVSARTEPRFTRDADLAVQVTDDRDAEALVRSLQDRGYRVLSAVEQEATGRLATIRLAPQWQTGSGVVVDLLFASSGIEREVVAAAEVL
jgi:Nucleotidyl transferase AbiEii toxin, Type IV TA system